MYESERIFIKKIYGEEILDSRGNPTVKASVVLNNNICTSASVPSGASTGIHEAHELRDNDKKRYNGKGVTKAVENINEKIDKLLHGIPSTDQRLADEIMIKADASENKENLGANAILAVSLAVAKSAAKALKMPLYRYIGGINAALLPRPMMNILNGGAHAANNIDIQEFMIIPNGAKTFSQGLQMCVEVFHSLGKLLKDKGLSTSVGDEGGFAPNLEDDETAIKYILDAVEKAGYVPYNDISIALDVASSEWYKDGNYIMPKKNKTFSKSSLIEYYEELCSRYPVISIEDPLSEDDFDGFTEITKRIGDKVQIVGDDLFVTNAKRLKKGIDLKSANAILIKVNQIGTLTETLETIALAHKNNYKTIISHRSGETEDTTIADLAVALNSGQIKTGAPSRTDRVAKYNRLLSIERELYSEHRHQL